MKHQDEILYYIEELDHLIDKAKNKVFGKSSTRFKDYNDFKNFILQDLTDILEGIDFHKNEDFE